MLPPPTILATRLDRTTYSPVKKRYEKEILSQIAQAVGWSALSLLAPLALLGLMISTGDRSIIDFAVAGWLMTAGVLGVVVTVWRATRRRVAALLADAIRDATPKRRHSRSSIWAAHVRVRPAPLPAYPANIYYPPRAIPTV